jgi:hypothetical protein
MPQDFYLTAAQQRANMIEAELASAKADLAAYKANNDVESAGSTVQQIANLTAEQQNLSNLYSAYVQSQQPQQAPELSPEERAAKPIHRMDYRDAYELAKSGSKYGVDDNAFRAGIAEVQRRKARGE